MSSGVDGLRRSNSRFHLRLKTSEGMKGARINFLREVQSANEPALVSSRWCVPLKQRLKALSRWSVTTSPFAGTDPAQTRKFQLDE
jgi:hypothetical protein